MRVANHGAFLSCCLNESPSEKEGKSTGKVIAFDLDSLNESPSEKEGKLRRVVLV